jgi:hypothetical protein
MAARSLSRRRWFLRDVPRTYVMLVWFGFAATVLIYFNDWRPSGWSALRPEAPALKPKRSEAEIYTGSIIIVPPGSDKCWELKLDNRTGRMWEKGYVNCYEAASPPEKDPSSAISSKRINAIGNAFRGKENN